MINPYFSLSKQYPILFDLSQLEWLRVIPVITPYIILLIIPFVKADRENKRIESLRESVIGWLHKIRTAIIFQQGEIQKMIEFLNEKTDTLKVEFDELPVNHLLQYPDADIRKVFYEKLSDKDITVNPSNKNDKYDLNMNHYLDIVSDLYQLKYSYTWLKEHFHNFNKKDYEFQIEKKSKNLGGVKLVGEIANMEINDDTVSLIPLINLFSEFYFVKRKKGEPIPQDYTDNDFFLWLTEFKTILNTGLNEHPATFYHPDFIKFNIYYFQYESFLKSRVKLYQTYVPTFQKQFDNLNKIQVHLDRYVLKHMGTPLEKDWFTP